MSTSSCIKNLPFQQAVTELEICRFVYKWTINNFSYYTEGTIESPKFSSEFSDFGDEWTLIVNPKHVYNDLSRSSTSVYHYLAITLKLHSFNDTKSKIFTKCNLIIDDLEDTKEFNTLTDEVSWPYFLDRDELMSPDKDYLSNDSLMIECELTLARPIESTASSKINNLYIANRQFGTDLEQLLLNKQSADVTIQVGEKSFHVIKGILAARSPVFAAMFDHEQFKEHKNNEVVIVDIDKDVFEEFLYFIYTNETKNIENMSMELLEVAEKYQVERLKDMCEAVIVKKISIENAAKILVFADKYNAKQLKTECLYYIKKNLRKILKTEEFMINRKLHGDVISEVLDLVVDN